MCAVSFVASQGQIQWPSWTSPDFTTTPPPNFSLTLDEIVKIRELLALKEAAERYDTATNQPNCEDPEKAQIFQALTDRLAALESTLKIALGSIEDLSEDLASLKDTLDNPWQRALK